MTFFVRTTKKGHQKIFIKKWNFPPGLGIFSLGFTATKISNQIDAAVFVKRTEIVSTTVDTRGVQYVHWVMHKCIMVKVVGKRNTHKVCKKQVNFS